jgi:hypothetical protein
MHKHQILLLVFRNVDEMKKASFSVDTVSIYKAEKLLETKWKLEILTPEITSHPSD